MTPELVIHPLDPVYDGNSCILILGTMPSPRSRLEGFYYGHPQNRFWPVLAGLFGETVPEGKPEREAFLLRHGIALWDVLRSCRISGAGDSTIRDPVPNDLGRILDHADIRAIFTNGGKASELYRKYCREATGVDAVALPSTSPANARMSARDLAGAYAVIREYI